MSKFTRVRTGAVTKVPTQRGGESALANNSVYTAAIQDLAVINSKLAQMAHGTVKGNVSGVANSPIDLTVTQLTSIFPVLTVQKFTSGSGTYNKNYAFLITTGSATVGATYTHNAVTYTVYATVASSNLIYLSGNAAPLASGTLTFASGTGDATLTFTQVVAPKYLRIMMVGGGGGGAGSSTQAAGNGGVGGTGGGTTFGASLIASGGNGGGAAGGDGGPGGAGSVSAPAIEVVKVTGGGGGASAVNPATTSVNSGLGGNSFFGGGAQGKYTGGVSAAGLPGVANTGGGGGGSAFNVGGGNGIPGGGGGAGAYVEALLLNPAATYSYAVGAGGAAGLAGTSGTVGGTGGSGVVIVEEYYF